MRRVLVSILLFVVASAIGWFTPSALEKQSVADTAGWAILIVAFFAGSALWDNYVFGGRALPRIRSERSWLFPLLLLTTVLLFAALYRGGTWIVVFVAFAAAAILYRTVKWFGWR